MESSNAAINWHGVFSMLKKLFPYLTNEDLKYSKGEEETLYNKLRSRLGLMPEQVENSMMQKTSAKKDLKNANDISSNAFEGISKRNDTTYFSQEDKSLSDTFKRDTEQKKMPATKAPEKEGYDAGIKHSKTDNDDRK